MSYSKRAQAFTFQGSVESCLLRIRSHYDGLLPSQKRIADFVTSNKRGILALDVTTLGRQAGVCAASVTRFCRGIGFGSFREFKIALAQETASLPIVFEQFSEADDDAARTNKIFAAYIQSLIDTRAIVSIPCLMQVADQIAKSEFVHLYGVGTSGTMAQEAGLRLTFAGVPNRPHVDVYEQIISASLVTRKDTAIGFSHSGTSLNTVESIRIARQHGAFTVAVTNYAGSPLAKAADVSLLTSLPEKAAHVATLSSRVAAADAGRVPLCRRRRAQVGEVQEKRERGRPGGEANFAGPCPKRERSISRRRSRISRLGPPWVRGRRNTCPEELS